MEKKHKQLGSKLTMIRPTSAEDFPICDSVRFLIEQTKSILSKADVDFMEDCFRGLSHEMQLVAAQRFIILLVENKWMTTGVNHVDDLIKQIVDRFSEKDLAIGRQYIKDKRRKNEECSDDEYVN